MGSDSIYPAQNFVVIDTNVVLDLWVFADPLTPGLEQALQTRSVCWIATPPMREELLRVLAYPQIAAKLAHYEKTADQVLLRFDTLAQMVPEAPRACYACKDADDQKFVDLAAAHRAALISKDKAVLTMTRRLERLGVTVRKVWPGP